MDYRGKLLELRQRSMRKGVWFRILSSLERAQVDLTVRIVEKVRSPRLRSVLDKIVDKLYSALQSKILLRIKSVGLPSAQKLSLLAQSWGNKSAKDWVQDLDFARFLAVLDLNSGASQRGFG